jgi:ADP-dependent NAD(P)H-hydrate dehydratase
MGTTEDQAGVEDLRWPHSLLLARHTQSAGNVARDIAEAAGHELIDIALRDMDAVVERSGHAALATSGSGDVLAGALAGLSARGTSPLHATLWAVHAHARAGACLAERDLGLGLLARELLDLLPAILDDP